MHTKLSASKEDNVVSSLVQDHIAAPLFPYNQCPISGNPCLSWDSSHYEQSHVLICVE